jgi:hypothetical protein
MLHCRLPIQDPVDLFYLAWRDVWYPAIDVSLLQRGASFRLALPRMTIYYAERDNHSTCPLLYWLGDQK